MPRRIGYKQVFGSGGAFLRRAWGFGGWLLWVCDLFCRAWVFGHESLRFWVCLQAGADLRVSSQRWVVAVPFWRRSILEVEVEIASLVLMCCAWLRTLLSRLLLLSG